MRIFVTEILAICPKDGQKRRFAGPNIRAINLKLAEEYCQQNGLGYCSVIGELESEIPQNEDLSPDWANEIDYKKIYLN